MEFLKIQQNALKNWFEVKTKDRAVIYKYCENENGFCITDNKAIFIIPKCFWLLGNDEEGLFKKDPNHIGRVLKEPSDLRQFEKTSRIEIIKDYSKPITAIVLETKYGDTLTAYVDKKYLEMFDDNCAIRGTRPDYPLYIYENRGENLSLAGIIMPVVK